MKESENAVKMQLLSHVRPFAILWTVARQAPLSMGFSRQGYWSGVPLPSPLLGTVSHNLKKKRWGVAERPLLGSRATILSGFQGTTGYPDAPHTRDPCPLPHVHLCPPAVPEAPGDPWVSPSVRGSSPGRAPPLGWPQLEPLAAPRPWQRPA